MNSDAKALSSDIQTDNTFSENRGVIFHVNKLRESIENTDSISSK